jgi:hypothetical protein
MSDNSHDQHEAHTGPVKTPKQMLLLSFASFVIPVFIIIGLVFYVTSANKPAAGAVYRESHRHFASRKLALLKFVMPIAPSRLVLRFTKRSVPHATTPVQLAPQSSQMLVLGVHVWAKVLTAW